MKILSNMINRTQSANKGDQAVGTQGEPVAEDALNFGGLDWSAGGNLGGGCLGHKSFLPFLVSDDDQIGFGR